MNTMDKERKFDLDRFAEMTQGYKNGVNLVDKSKIRIEDKFTIPSWTMWVVQLEK